MAAAILAATLAAAQPRPEVDVGIGSAAYRPKPAQPYALLYRPYVEMAALAYTDLPLRDGRLCPDARKLADPRRTVRDHAAFENPEGGRWLKDLRRSGWSCLFGQVGPIGCPAGQECAGGLQYQVWRRAGCGEAAIAFRGTDAGDLGDWVSNLRWFVARKVFDQYDQVQAAIPHIIDRIGRSGCRPRRIVATGHSLGGGLAQHVALADHRIGYVYAFDPSPVIGFFDVPYARRSGAIERLGIDRVYEAGEVLSLPRYLASGLLAATPCRPRVRIVRFPAIDAPSLIDRHRVAHMTRDVVARSQGPKPARLPDGYNNARDCDFSGNDPEMN